MLGNRYSQHSFAQIPSVNMARSQFDRSSATKGTFYFDLLNPVFVDEVIPGDTMNLDLNMFARLSTQVVPVMDNMMIDFFFFFVPCRLVWDNWEKFCGAQTNPGDSTDFVVPQKSVTGLVGSLEDMFGLPPTGSAYTVNAMPFRAYNLIWNEWFRDQNLQDSLTVDTSDGPDVTVYGTQYRGKRHDYFSSALPWPQKGPNVQIPLSASIPVLSDGAVPIQIKGVTEGINRNIYINNNSGAGATLYASSFGAGAPEQALWGTDTGLIVNASSAGTINALRQAFQIQSLLELDARGGTRFNEILMAHYKVMSPDARLQRPEFLGGGQAKINVHPVPQTSPTSGMNPQGQLAAFATAASSGSRIGFTKSFVEHGYVIGLMSARSDLTYQQGVNRMWNRTTRYDFFWPKLQEIGEQTILNKEIFVQGTSADSNVFGYQERYAEYRYKPSDVRGKFRSDAVGTLDYWHLAQDFAALPSLNGAFIESDTPWERITAIDTEPPILMDMFFSLKHTRPMATYSIPASLGRF